MKPLHIIFVFNVFVAGWCADLAIGLAWSGHPVGGVIVALGAVANVVCAKTVISRLM